MHLLNKESAYKFNANVYRVVDIFVAINIMPQKTSSVDWA